MGDGAAMVQRQYRASRHFLFRHQSVVRRQSAPAVIEGDHPVGRLCRSLSRRAFSRRHPEPVHDQLVHRTYAASFARRTSRELADGWHINTLHFWLRNNLDSGAFRGSQAQWDKIDVPMFSVGNWSGMGLHLRGNTEAFMRAASPHKKLRIHLGSHVHPFYTEDARRDQIRFFDYWLKGIDNGVMKEPPVKLAIRQGGNAFEWRNEHEWPLARTRWTKFYLDLSRPADERAGVSSQPT
jgi:putative CocE/NonD family hydrolase